MATTTGEQAAAVEEGTLSERLARRPAVSTLSFEQAQAELEAVVEALEDRHTGLDDALALWERGEALHAWCQRRLDHAAERLQKLTLTDEEVAAAAAETGDAFAPAGSVPEAAAADPAPPSSPSDDADGVGDAAADGILLDDQTIF